MSADTLVVPDKMEKGFNAYSPFFRNISLAKDIHKLKFSVILFMRMHCTKTEI